MNSAGRDVSGDFPDSGKTYLNNASVSLMPSQSIDAMKEFLISYNSVGPDSADSKPFIEEKLRGVRRLVSGIIGCRPEEIVLTQSTSDGINIVANGMPWEADCNMIIRGMAHEHHSNLYPWLRLRDRVDVRSLDIDKDGFFAQEQLESQIDEDTGLVALSHVLYNTGAILPVREIGRQIDGRVPYFLDAAQSVGCIDGIDVSKIGCDFMSFNGSKWLCGPMGTGLFYCSSKAGWLLEPGSIGGESATYEGGQLRYKDIPDRFQTGFRNYVGMVGLESSARYLADYGFDNIRKRNIRLAGILRDELSRMPGATVYGPEDPEKRSSIVPFALDGMEPQHVVDRLERQNIVLAVREMVDRKIVRASPHLFNTEEEMTAVADAIRNL